MRMLAILVFSLLIVGCAHTGIIVREFKPEQIIHYSKLQNLEDDTKLTNYVAYLNEGETFPLELSIDTGIINVADKRINLIVQQKLYFLVKMPENLSKEELAKLENLDKEALSKMSESDKKKLFKGYMIYIGKDARNWVPLSDIKAVKEAFGIKEVRVSFGFGMSKKVGIISHLNIETIK